MKYREIAPLDGEINTGQWWCNMDKKKGEKWQTLIHNGPYFPPAYEPLPSDITILYKGKPMKLDSKNTNNKFGISAEEAMVFFASQVDRDERLKDNKKRARNSEEPIFRANFWKDWKQILGEDSKIKHFDKVDFKPVAQYLFRRSEEKKLSNKNKSKSEKEQEKEDKESLKQIYGFALLDGVKLPMDYTIEIPGLFQGHGKHPLQGRIKKRITPEDVILNISDSHVPKCSVRGKTCKWGGIVENRDVTWLYTWKNPITGEMSTKGLTRIDSPFVCSKDMEKFDKAQMLEKNIKNIREKYTADLSNKLQTKRELATAVYLLDTLAIRPGTEKDEAVEADTVGLTTLRCENISFEAGNLITLDFTGKSSIRFVKTFQVSEEVFKNLKSFCASRSGKDELFPLLSATTLNDYLKTLLPSLTAKVFRTWKASSILQKALNEEKVDEDEPVHVKQLAYNKVNIEVAKALNHKKMSDSDTQVTKLQAKLNEQEEKLKVAKTDSQKRLAQKAIDMAKVKLIEAQENISTGTSKLNYLDPRISIAWAKKVGLPIEKIYNARTAKKFVWAMDSPSTWRFAEIGIKKKRK